MFTELLLYGNKFPRSAFVRKFVVHTAKHAQCKGHPYDGKKACEISNEDNTHAIANAIATFPILVKHFPVLPITNG